MGIHLLLSMSFKVLTKAANDSSGKQSDPSPPPRHPKIPPYFTKSNIMTRVGYSSIRKTTPGCFHDSQSEAGRSEGHTGTLQVQGCCLGRYTQEHHLVNNGLPMLKPDTGGGFTTHPPHGWTYMDTLSCYGNFRATASRTFYCRSSQGRCKIMRSRPVRLQ